MIKILPSAREDLAVGADFYETQAEGLARTFWNLCLAKSISFIATPASIQ
jgi:hypothetical protein